MRLLIYLLTIIFLSSCTTIEVTKEVVKVGNVVKEKVEEQFEKEEVIIEDNTIVEEQKMHVEFNDKEPQFREMLEFKKAVWNSIMPGDINTLMKVGGFERLKKVLAIKSGI